MQRLTEQDYPYMPLRTAYASLRVAHRSLPRNVNSEQTLTPTLRSHEIVKPWFQHIVSTANHTAWCTALQYRISMATPTCSNVIGFGLGRFAQWAHTHHLSRAANRDGCAWQHALLLIVRDALRRKLTDQSLVTCSAQDPEYSEVDKALLDHHEVAVVDDPAGLVGIDRNTAVISCRAAIPVKQIIADIVCPAFIIWDRYGAEYAHYST